MKRPLRATRPSAFKAGVDTTAYSKSAYVARTCIGNANGQNRTIIALPQRRWRTASKMNGFCNPAVESPK